MFMNNLIQEVFDMILITSILFCKSETLKFAFNEAIRK